mmetsp:Transcript_18374/g.37628  ORF Transcript_18374/g.37628 Transcript_18374/m.37628 type:complete len:94 (+) Transcript_18374:835-1116(+)
MAIPPSHAPLGNVSDGKQAQSMGDVLVVQHAGIFGVFHEVDGERGDFGDHDAPDGVGHGGVGFGEDELDVVRLDGKDFDFGEALLRHFLLFFF